MDDGHVIDETHELRASGPLPPPQPTIGVELRRVLPVASEDLGGGLRVISVELYDQGLVLRWLAAPPPDENDMLLDGSIFELSDDAGTAYRRTSAGSFGHEDSVRGELLYVPAPPASATVLTIEAAAGTVRVSLA